MGTIDVLSWDSNFFGFPVARLSAVVPRAGGLREDLLRAEADGIRLVYWECPPEDVSANAAAAICGGRLVDHKCLFVRAVARDDALRDAGTFYSNDQRPSPSARDRLIGLAIASGELSRFKVDPAMPEGKWEELYRLWMEGSLDGRLADAVLAAEADGLPIGMVSVCARDGTGVIGLFAVAAEHRGRGVGRRLLARAASWFAARDMSRIDVVTQGANKAAAAAYTRAGYVLAKSSNFYHFWLGGTGAIKEI